MMSLLGNGGVSVENSYKVDAISLDSDLANVSAKNLNDDVLDFAIAKNDTRETSSVKLRVIKDCLELLYKGKPSHKVLIFSNYPSLLNVVKDYVCQNSLLIGKKNFQMISGNVSKSKKAEAIDKFEDPKNDEFLVMLVSKKSGGSGITLNASTVAFHLEVAWDPTGFEQCVFRNYRNGQRFDVHHIVLLIGRIVSPTFWNYQFSVLRTAIAKDIVAKMVSLYGCLDYSNTELPIELAASDSPLLRFQRCSYVGLFSSLFKTLTTPVVNSPFNQ